MDFDGSVKPLLAERWEQLGPTTWRFYLRHGVKFHDDSELTAEDVKFSFERYKGTPREPDVYQWYESSRVVDRYTIEVKTKGVFAPFLEMLGGVMIVPRRYVEAMGEDYVRQHPVGSGPFRFSGWERNNYLELAAFEGYWQGRPYLDRVVFRPIVEPSARLAALLSGSVDAVDSVAPGDIARLKNDPRIGYVETVALHHEELIINHNKPPFDNPKVREAIARLIPRDQIVRVVYRGTRIPAFGPITPAQALYHHEGIREMVPTYDVQRARELLREAGYPNGFRTAIQVDQDPVRVQVAEVIAQSLRQAGIDARIQQYEWGSFVNMLLDENSPNLLDLVVLWFSIDWDPNSLSYLFGYDNRSPACCNITAYRHPRLEELFVAGRQTLDPQKRRGIYREA